MTDTSIVFEGRNIAARPGETIAAALTRAGERALRPTEAGDMRGLFCGMGVCQECAVLVDGRPALACMTKIVGPHEIRRQARLPALRHAAAGEPAPPPEIETPGLAVIGGGAAGLAAAAVAAESGLDVLLIDERPAPGGQYYKGGTRFGVPPCRRRHESGGTQSNVPPYGGGAIDERTCQD